MIIITFADFKKLALENNKTEETIAKEHDLQKDGVFTLQN